MKLSEKNSGTDVQAIIANIFFIGIAGIILGVWIAFPDLLTEWKGQRGFREELNEIGDLFGALNTLFTGFAFALLIFTAWMQSKELALQREELTETRQVFEKQKEIQNEHLLLLKEESERRLKLDEIEMSPKLMLRLTGTGLGPYQIFVKHVEGIDVSYWINFKLMNVGAPIHDLKLLKFVVMLPQDVPKLLETKIAPDIICEKEQPVTISARFENHFRGKCNFEMAVEYRNPRGEIKVADGLEFGLKIEKPT